LRAIFVAERLVAAAAAASVFVAGLLGVVFGLGGLKARVREEGAAEGGAFENGLDEVVLLEGFGEVFLYVLLT